MSQVWNIAIPSNELLSTSRTTINDAFQTLQTHWIGSSNPSTLVDGMIWVNTTNGKLKARAGGVTYDIGNWAQAYLGLLPIDGSIAMTANLNMGSHKITGVTAGSTGTTEAANAQQIDSRLSRAGDTLDASAALHYSSGSPPTLDAYALTNKEYCDLKVLKSGDTGISGRLAYSVSPAFTADWTRGSGEIPNILRRDEIENLTSFNTSVGHSHDGNNSRKIEVTSLLGNGQNPYDQLIALGGSPPAGVAWEATHGPHVLNDTPGTTLFTRTTDVTSYTDVDASAAVPAEVRARKQVLIIYLSIAGLIGVSTIFHQFSVRSAGGSGGTDYDCSFTFNGIGHMFLVPLSASRHFEYKLIGPSASGGTVTAKPLGYLSNP
jgi:hypothetical protein